MSPPDGKVSVMLLGEELRTITNSSRRKEASGPEWKRCWVADVSGDEGKVWCCKEQYCIGARNVRSMNQGKMEVVRQEVLWVNIDTLGISELKWTGMGEFNSDDNYTYYCVKDPLEEMGVALTVNKSLKCSTWVQSQKGQNDLSLFSRQTIQHHSKLSLCPNHWCQRSQSWPVL